MDTIREEFGEVVARIVWNVTDEPGEDRKTRKARTYQKLRGDELAIILKLADRIANVEASLLNNPRLLAVYREEHAHFEELREGCCSAMAEQMWTHLKDLFHSS